MKERETERLKKKVADQKRELEALRGELKELRAGSGELQAMVDALLTAVALTWGQEPESGESKVRELRLARFNVEELRRDYELRARRQGEGYILRVSSRTEAMET